MSLRWRLILSHMAIVILSMAVIAGSVMALLQGYRDDFAEARLDDMTMPIYIQARSLAQGEGSLAEVWEGLVEQAQETGVLILLVDDDGKVKRQVSPEGSVIEAPISRLPIGLLPEDLSEPYHGTYKIPDGETIVYAAYPLAPLFRTGGAAIPAIMVLAVPRQSALSLWTDFSQPFIWAGLIALGVSVVVAFLLARSVYRPIQRVTDAADQMAQGRYEQAIPVSGPSEVRGLARSFNLMAGQVRLSQQRLRDFLADVSHELRTPLTSIRGFAQAIADGTARDEDTRARSAQIIADESDRVTRLVNELLELSKIESGQIEMQRELVDLKVLVEHCVEVFSLRAEEAKTRILTDLESVPELTGDPDRLEQVFTNLLDNAIKHTSAGGEVRVRARSVPPDTIEVSVIDSGTGILEEELPHVFARFYRADAARPGAGLGLAIAREIVRAHGGDIEARNAPGKGAEFLVRLRSQKDSPAQ